MSSIAVKHRALTDCKNDMLPKYPN